MKKQPKVSIIIPVIAINDYIMESIPKILELDYSDFEIIIFPDQLDSAHHWPKTKIISSGKVGPAEKRDLAIKYAKGEILAFLDDDAYPKKDWLRSMIPVFYDDKVGAVGGPAITPKNDGVLQKVSGAIFESFLGGGFTRNRYLPIGKISEVDDWPTVNLLIRKEVFIEVGGFNCVYWPGEDTKLCLDVTNAGYKIIFNPLGLVYHHRRSDLMKHFKQIGSYALHRGFFARKYPKTSLKIGYFVPTLFDLYLIFLTFNFAWKWTFQYWVFVPAMAYLCCLFLDAIVVSIRWRNILIGLIVIPMIFLTQVWYGLRFVQGLILPKLKR